MKIGKRNFRYDSELFIQVVVETEVSFVLGCDAMYPGSCGPKLGCVCDHLTPSSSKVKKYSYTSIPHLSLCGVF